MIVDQAAHLLTVARDLLVLVDEFLVPMTSGRSATIDGAAKFGLATNGEEFRFVKWQSQGDRAIVDLSAILSVMPPSRSQLPQVIQILKSLAQ